jgi:hypothetical protein
MSTVCENRLFLGNPGAGKSTLINCLLGGNHTQSGISWGGGLTKEYQRFVKDGIAYMDTPGLADDTIQVQAAQAITKALKQSGTYKLFFLVRLQNGRVVSEDLATLERVLDSIEAGDLNYKFTIVINCVGERQYASLMARGDEFKRIKTLINRRYLTESFCFVPRIEALEEKANVVVELPHEVRDFLEKKSPVITVDERQVRPIAVAGFAQQSQAIKSEIEKLRHDQAALLRTMREQEKRHDEVMERMRASHAAELDRLNKAESPATVFALSATGNRDYMVLPPTPSVTPPTATSSSWFIGRKRLVTSVIGVLVAIAVAVVIIVAATQSTHTEATPAPTPSSPPTTPPPTQPPTPSELNVTTPSASLSIQTKFLGCLTSEDMMSKDRLLYNGAAAINYDVALNNAVTSNKQYFAIARLLVDDGYEAVFDKLLIDAADFDGNDAGCKLQCPASRVYYCGCADDVCKSASVKPGLRQTINRRWAVYERQSA